MWVCTHCGQENRAHRIHCWKCSIPKNKPSAAEPLLPASRNNLSGVAGEPASETGANSRESTPIDPIIGECKKCQKEIRESHPYGWCTECGESLSNDVKAKLRIWHASLNKDTSERSSNNETNEPSASKLPRQIPTEPISRDALGFLRIVGVGVAILGIIAGGIILFNAPKGPSDIALQYSSGDLNVQLSRAVRLLHLSLGWGQIVGSIVTGVVLNVIAGIGDAVLDIWKRQQQH
jgi:hypothetical protein